jgi:hypothetical protein
LQPSIIDTKPTYMKTFKLVLIVLACLCYTSKASAQIVQIYDYNDTLLGPIDLSGTVVNANPGGTIKRFFIKNVSVGSFNFRIERVKIEVADGADDYFAFGSSEGVATVYSYPEVSPYYTFMSPDTFLLGMEIDGYLGSHYIYNESVGCSQYRYYVVNDSTERVDSIDVRYCTGFASVEENELGISVYPNPTADRICLRAANMINGTIVICDLSGRELIRREVSDLTKVDLGLSFLSSGIYSISVIDQIGNEMIFNDKFIIK